MTFMGISYGNLGERLKKGYIMQYAILILWIVYKFERDKVSKAFQKGGDILLLAISKPFPNDYVQIQC